MRWLPFLLLFGVVAHASTPPGAAEPPVEKPGEKEFLGCTKYPAGKKFRWGVRGEVGVAELVASLGEISCQAIVVGPGVAQRSGKVAIEVPDLITAPEVWHLFYNALDALGFTVEHSGKVLKIVDGGRGKEVARPLAAGESTPSGDPFVIRVLHPTHARAQELSDVLGKLKSKEGDVSVWAAGGALLVTDHGENVRRMEELLSQLDVERPPTGDKLWSIATHAQTASELAATLEKILMAGKRDEGAPASTSSRPGAPSTTSSASTAPGPLASGVAALVPVDAAHVLVMVGDEAGFRRVRELVTRFDPSPGDDASGQAHVVYLANTNADELVTTLQQLGLGGRGSISKPSNPMPGAAPPSPAASGPALQLAGDVRIAADKVSNAIVVFASGGDFSTVRDLIHKLDVPRRQVFVEATILDVGVEKGRTVGISLYGGHDVGGGTTLLGGLNAPLTANNDGAIVLDAKAVAGALAGGLGLLGPAINIAGQSIPSFGVILQAIENSKDVSVISRPHLLTMDNVKATLSVGQTFPVQTSSLGAAGSAANSLISSYGRQEVALKLDLTPHLNESDSVRLELEGEISDVPEGQTSTSPGGPITNKRTIKTAVVVKDGETVVLGGLQKDGYAESISKVPLLGDIPVLGRLFQTRSRQRVKQDLLIVLTPYVIRSPEDLRGIERRKADERREFVERFTAFRDESAYEVHVDYRRKRGLLEEINQSAQRAESDAASLRAAERALHPGAPTDGPLEP
jgi:general secretion pathway protein D